MREQPWEIRGMNLKLHPQRRKRGTHHLRR